MAGSTEENYDHHEEHEEGEPWLVSYADMMTLLFGFFVIMYAFTLAKLDEDHESMIRLRKEFATFFGGEFVTPLEKPMEIFKKTLEGTPLADAVDIMQTPEGVIVTFRSTSFFLSGSASLMPAAIIAIDNIYKLVTESAESYKITVEGHTDDVPIASRVYPSNWELSASRAAAVVKEFQIRGFNPKKLRAIGMGEFFPLEPNRAPDGTAIRDNMAKNRRVVISIFSDGQRK